MIVRFGVGIRSSGFSACYQKAVALLLCVAAAELSEMSMNERATNSALEKTKRSERQGLPRCDKRQCADANHHDARIFRRVSDDAAGLDEGAGHDAVIAREMLTKG